MKTEREVWRMLEQVRLRLAQVRALGEGSSGEARRLEGTQAALQWVLGDGFDLV